MHSAFKNAGTSKGLEVWRIENFEPVPVPKKTYGKFYTGDSYIVLNTKQTKNGIFSWDVHFWLGLETSQDEAGSAAILSVQLDDRHNGAPVQHREVQDHESSLFLSYFPGGVRYAEGGVKSGFNEVETNAAGEKRLFHVKGSKNVRVRQVALGIASMNKGDCFILDAGNAIYVYVGPRSKRVEKIKAISAASQIRDQDHAGRANVYILDEFASAGDQQEFFDVLGEGSPDEVADESESDDTYEENLTTAITLYRVSDAGGSLEIIPVGERPLKQSMLDSDDCFILDTGSSGIFVWVGKGATSQERAQSMIKAQEFISSKGYPVHTQVHRVIENGERTDFKQYFASWKDKGVVHSHLIKAAMDDDSSEAGEEKEFDPEILHMFKKNGGRALGFMPDNGQGEAEIWRVENFELVPADPQAYGMFFGGDSYVIKYEYRNKRGGHGFIIYFWQGKESSTDEKASAALHAVRLDNELNGKAVQVRVTQGNEPRHFLKIFKGKLINFTGGHASGFRNIHDHDSYDVDGTRLFRIRGTCSEDIRAEQLPETASSLASDDVFILETPSATYIWHGVGASNLEKEMAANIVKIVSPDAVPEIINEGSEPDAFWDALGGKADYDHELDPAGAPFLNPRLFHCRILFNKRLRVEEVPHFEQDDLNVDDVMVLDGGDEIYVWIGNGATDEERAKSIDMAKQYIRTDPSERNEDTVPIVILKQGDEPRSFKRLFPSWDDSHWESQSSYETIRQKIMDLNEPRL
ncbi:gelsolin, cytoplasmic-like isoform X2 [Wyeomyia smithii]|uniref:gelsolin, cytoplasmic-like isoform X2 n=1 Tax=Wyeomyia smithii TaxID=174621 RepID=UPI002467C658|nr:gelsolin, cytoplasmic-like isoform X2 [Wyeomyia smithii]XP_055534857.1 gelsolin, cytoplasmic-like isoform X2 [Wyeomyia smithii]